jgi:hypothetical protein
MTLPVKDAGVPRWARFETFLVKKIGESLDFLE